VETSIVTQIRSLQRMTVADLRHEWERLYGEPTRSRNRDFLWRRLAWRVQELAHGGLSEAAKAKIVKFAPTPTTRARVPAGLEPPAEAPGRVETRTRTIRDSRLPSPGTVLSRRYRGREIRVLVFEDGYEWDGRKFDSLTAVARTVTGQHWNGRLFFGVTQRKRRK
jgi:hypothetical protein